MEAACTGPALPKQQAALEDGPAHVLAAYFEQPAEDGIS
jgi:hypothetical protein